MAARSRAFTVLVTIVIIAAGCSNGSSTDSVRADAGNDFNVAVGQSPQFDGCGSDGDIENYQWTIRDTPTDMADDIDKVLRQTGSECTFDLETAMIVDEVGEWTIELEVRDPDGNSSRDTVIITVTG